MSKNQKVLGVIVLAALLVGGYFMWSARKQHAGDLYVPNTKEVVLTQEQQMRVAIEKVLAEPRLANSGQPMPKGIKLLSVKVQDNHLIFDFSKEIESGDRAMFEDISSLVFNATHDIIQGTGKEPRYEEVRYTVLVEGEEPFRGL